MSSDFSTWSWLSSAEQEELMRDPNGPVRPALAQRLKNINLGMGMRTSTSPAGVTEHFLSGPLAAFVSQQ